MQISKVPTTDCTDKSDEQMIHEEVSGKIIGAAMKVLNELKPGLDENYTNAR